MSRPENYKSGNKRIEKVVRKMGKVRRKTW